MNVYVNCCNNMKLYEILAAIERFAPLSIQESWDNAGLVCGDPDMDVTGAVVGFDCTKELIGEAVSRGANLVVTHHPLIFKGVKRILPGEPVSAALVAAIKNDVAVYAAHTNADKVMEGVSGAMGRALRLEDMEFLDGDGISGLGVVGNLPEPLPVEEFVPKVKQAFGCAVLRCSRALDCPVSRVALCGGAGSSLIEKARLSGAQAYITGDLSYHDFFTHDGFMVMDIGHYEGEEAITGILFSVIKKNFPNFAVYIANTKHNPVSYL